MNTLAQAGLGSSGADWSLIEASIEDVHRAYSRCAVSCRALVTAYQSRIAAYDKHGPALNAFITLNPRALAIADELDAIYSRGGAVGKLHGVPIVLKDNFNTIDLRTTCGLKALAGMRPSADAAVVSRLRRAGAVIIGKANLHELALSGMTESSLGGQSLNPYDLTRTPGGSSGGTAVAIAANLALGGTGSDTLNSIRSPASATSLVGIRPTIGLVPRTGIMPNSSTQDSVGPLARSVSDACRMLEVMAGPDPSDIETSRAPQLPSLDEFLVPGGLRSSRIGVLRNWFGTQPIHEPVNRVMEGAIRTMRDAGATIVDLAEVSLDAEELIADNSVDLYEFRELLERYLASIPGAPVRRLREIIASDTCLPSSLGFLIAADEVVDGMKHPDYLQRLQRNQDVRRRLATIFESHGLNAIVYPLQKRLAVSITESDQVDRNGVLAAVTGFPAITVPAGFSSPTPTAPIGVPVGMDILGLPWSEPQLIRLAYSFEQESLFRRAPVSAPQL